MNNKINSKKENAYTLDHAPSPHPFASRRRLCQTTPQPPHYARVGLLTEWLELYYTTGQSLEVSRMINVEFPFTWGTQKTVPTKKGGDASVTTFKPNETSAFFI